MHIAKLFSFFCSTYYCISFEYLHSHVSQTSLNNLSSFTVFLFVLFVLFIFINIYSINYKKRIMIQMHILQCDLVSIFYVFIIFFSLSRVWDVWLTLFPNCVLGFFFFFLISRWFRSFTPCFACVCVFLYGCVSFC